MVVDKYVGRCLDVGSTPTGSIIPLHSFAFLGKTLLNQRFCFVFGIPWYSFAKKADPKTDPVFKKGIQKRIQHFCRILKIYVLHKAFFGSIMHFCDFKTC